MCGPALLQALVHASLQSGADVEDTVLAQVVALAVRRISFTPSFDEDSGAWSLAPREDSGGWLLQGFPMTAAQAEVLEKELSGTDRLDIDGEPDEELHKQMIAPAPPPGQAPPLLSGVDVVLRLDLEDEAASARALGRRIDPETGVVYHLTDRPPPDDEVCAAPALLEQRHRETAATPLSLAVGTL